jgi:hypothetical protein
MTAHQIENLKSGPCALLRLCAIRALAAFLLAAAVAKPAHADWIRDFKTEALYNDNVSRSSRDEDARDDFAFSAAARVGKFTHLASGLRFTLTLDVDSQLWAQYNDFNHTAAGGTASLRYRFGLGANAPFIRVEGSAKYAEFDQDLQDGARYRATVVVGKRFGERLEAQLAYLFDRADARDSLFEVGGHSFLARVAVDVTPSTQLSAEYSARRGEVVSYAVPPRPDLVALAHKRIEVDTFGEPYVAYNLDATTHRLGLGLGQALTKKLGVSLRYEWQVTSRAQIEYTNHVVLAAFQVSF